MVAAADFGPKPEVDEPWLRAGTEYPEAQPLHEEDMDAHFERFLAALPPHPVEDNIYETEGALLNSRFFEIPTGSSVRPPRNPSFKKIKPSFLQVPMHSQCNHLHYNEVVPYGVYTRYPREEGFVTERVVDCGEHGGVVADVLRTNEHYAYGNEVQRPERGMWEEPMEEEPPLTIAPRVYIRQWTIVYDSSAGI